MHTRNHACAYVCTAVRYYLSDFKKPNKCVKNVTKMLSEYQYINWVSYLGRGWCMVFSVRYLQDMALRHSAASGYYRVWFGAGVL